MKQSFKIKVRYLSRSKIVTMTNNGENTNDQTVQVWGTDLWSAANEWGINCPNDVFQITALDGTILFSNGGDHPIR